MALINKSRLYKCCESKLTVKNQDPGLTVLGTDSVWVVFELNVSSSGTVTVNPVNTYSSSSTGSGVTKRASDAFDEYYLFRNLPKK